MIRTIGLGLLAALTFSTIVFVLVELRAARHVDESRTSALLQATPSPSTAGTTETGTTTKTKTTAEMKPSPPPQSAQELPPSSGSVDPLDRVVQGKTRREWRSYYAERQQRIIAEIERYQDIVDRAERGEEPDPRALGEAHVRIAELKDRMKRDLEALSLIENSQPTESAP